MHFILAKLNMFILVASVLLFQLPDTKMPKHAIV